MWIADYKQNITQTVFPEALKILEVCKNVKDIFKWQTAICK